MVAFLGGLCVLIVFIIGAIVIATLVIRGVLSMLLR